MRRLGRAGLVAKGILYLVVALLATRVALGSDGDRGDRNGALREIAAQPCGRGLLGLLALGLFGYAGGGSPQGVYDRDDKGDDAPGWRSARARSGAGGGTAASAY